MTVPTMTKMLKVYVDSAIVERLKCGRPGEGTVRNTITGLRAFRRWLNERRERLGYGAIGLDEDFPLVSIVRADILRAWLTDMLKKGVKPITAMSYVGQLRQLFARWVRPYYEDRGWKVPPFPSLGGRPKAPRYQRPSSDQLAKVKVWYESLEPNGLWFVATMMLEFAMRNSDVLRLKRENFIEREGMVYLNYTPHKTENSSGRIVRWPVHEVLWQKIKKWNFDYDEDTFCELNRKMRELGFKGTKGAYELRKICVDHIYQRYGAEKATSISGDDIKTIIRYYADPSQPNIGAVRVVDLL